jgi:hypothetical protein
MQNVYAGPSAAHSSNPNLQRSVLSSTKRAAGPGLVPSPALPFDVITVVLLGPYWLDTEFFLFYIFLSFFQKYMVRKRICKTIHLTLWGAALGTYRRALWRYEAHGTVAPPATVGHGGRSPISFQKFVFFCLNSDGGKLYMKIVAFDEIDNFVVQSFSI